MRYQELEEEDYLQNKETYGKQNDRSLILEIDGRRACFPLSAINNVIAQINLAIESQLGDIHPEISKDGKLLQPTDSVYENLFAELRHQFLVKEIGKQILAKLKILEFSEVVIFSNQKIDTISYEILQTISEKCQINIQVIKLKPNSFCEKKFLKKLHNIPQDKIKWFSLLANFDLYNFKAGSGLIQDFQTFINHLQQNQPNSNIFSHLPSDNFTQLVNLALETEIFISEHKQAELSLEDIQWKSWEERRFLAEILSTDLLNDFLDALCPHLVFHSTHPAPQFIGAEFDSSHFVSHWSQKMHLIECSLAANPLLTAHLSFALLSSAYHEVFHNEAYDHLALQLMRFHKKLINFEHPDQVLIVPRIKEILGDIHQQRLNNIEANNFYNSTYFNINSAKRSALLKLKQFFPIATSTKEEREKQFYQHVKMTITAGLVTTPTMGVDTDPNIAVMNLLVNLERILDRQTNFNTKPKTEDLKYNSLLDLKLSKKSLVEDKLPYFAGNRDIAEHIYAVFLRKSVGWISTDLCFVEIFRACQFSLQKENFSATLYNLLTLSISLGRHLKAEIRRILSDLTMDLASRLQDNFSLCEAIILRSFQMIFFDGSLSDCRIYLRYFYQRKQTSLEVQNDLVRKIRLICYLEKSFKISKSKEKLSDIKINQILAKFRLTHWETGRDILNGKIPIQSPRKQNPYPIISEMLDAQLEQLLIYTSLCIEGDNASAQEFVNQQARQHNHSEWMSESYATLAFFPESIAANWKSASEKRTASMDNFDPLLHSEIDQLERAYLQTKQIERGKDLAKFGFVHKIAKKLKMPINSTEFLGNSESAVNQPSKSLPTLQQQLPWGGCRWSYDLSIVNGLRFERVAVPDHKRLANIALAAEKSGFYWLAKRLRKKVGLVTLPKPVNKKLRQPRQRAKQPPQTGRTDKKSASALNQEKHHVSFMTTYLSNFVLQLSQHTSLTQSDKEKIAVQLLKSMPTPSDAFETVFAGFVKSAADLLKFPLKSEDKPPQYDKDALPQENRPLKTAQNSAPKANIAKEPEDSHNPFSFSQTG